MAQLIRGYEVVIGLETHVQLSTQSKQFSNASTAFGAAPNTQATYVDLALPGTLPVMNKASVEKAIAFGLAIGATINTQSTFERKNYFYPDLPKGYQISQFITPIVSGGVVSFFVGDEAHTVNLTRAHLEEDAGKSLHENFDGMSGIDLNRAGTPLLEIVTEPEMRSSKEAAAYARALHALVMWLNICDGNLQEGSFRCDANVSVRKPGEPFGTRAEIKNLNSFKFLEKAIDYEVRRQIELIEDGGTVVQETRLYDPDRDETRSMRSKEDAHDYRYFPDPDLPPLVVKQEEIERVEAALPELPQEVAKRIEAFGFPAHFADSVVASKAKADDFLRWWETLVTEFEQNNIPLSSAVMSQVNMFMNEVGAELNRQGYEGVWKISITPAQRARLNLRIADGSISTKIAKDLWALMSQRPETGDDYPDRLIEAKGLKQISDTGALEKIIDEVIASNAKSVEEFRAGKEKAFQSLVGQAMKATKGKANPQQVNELLRRKLA